MYAVRKYIPRVLRDGVREVSPDNSSSKEVLSVHIVHCVYTAVNLCLIQNVPMNVRPYLHRTTGFGEK
jgi:hypothetical protein